MTMRQVALTAPRRLQLIDTADPPAELGPHDVLIHVAVVGVCGSDVHYFTRGRIGAQVVEYPFVIGHEASGVVTAIGDAVTRVRPGDAIAIEPAISCGQCDQCRAGRPHTCRHLRFLGCPGQVAGCMAEQIVMPETCCYPLPAGVRLEQAALAEPLSIGVYAAQLVGDLRDKTVGILGVGPIGLCTLQAVRRADPAAVCVTDKLDDRLAAAAQLGADWIGNVTATDVVADINQRIPDGLDVVIECCGQQEALDQALDLLKPGGTLLIVGIPETDRVSFSIDAMRRKEICVQNVRRQNDCLARALEWISDGRVDVDALVTHRFALHEAQSAFELVADYRDGVIKALLALNTQAPTAR